MLINSKSISASEYNSHANGAGDVKISAPCGRELVDQSLCRFFISSIFNSNKSIKTIRCGETDANSMTRLCSECYADFNEQTAKQAADRDPENVPLNAFEENVEVDIELEQKQESALRRFAKAHPVITGIAGIAGAVLVGGVFGKAAENLYELVNADSNSASLLNPTLAPTVPTVKTTAKKVNIVTKEKEIDYSQIDRLGVRKIRVATHNLLAEPIGISYEFCGKKNGKAPEKCIHKHTSLGAGREATFNFDIKLDFQRVKAIYSMGSVSYNIKDSINKNVEYHRGSVPFVNSTEIDGLDKNVDQTFEVRHTLLKVDNSYWLDQAREDETGMPDYASVTTKAVKLVLDNQWYVKSYFDVKAKRLGGDYSYQDVAVGYYKEKDIKLGTSKLEINTELALVGEYGIRTFDGQSLNKAINEAASTPFKNNICITSTLEPQTVNGANTYLTPMKAGRCGR